ncbi:hypothetical protein BGY98DRAFT_665983 [Russula aff. rugulosa BPL654]|nr:hypothetical protein BGY98DRAFT_665983 [Russula aff. rugulosa BPL654]
MECIYTYTIPPILPTDTGFPFLTEFSDLPSISSQPHFPPLGPLSNVTTTRSLDSSAATTDTQRRGLAQTQTSVY